jgi:hypothetical protein
MSKPTTPVTFVLFSGPVELAGFGHVSRIDTAKPLTVNYQDVYAAPEMWVEGGILYIKHAKGLEKLVLASGVVRQFR